MRRAGIPWIFVAALGCGAGACAATASPPSSQTASAVAEILWLPTGAVLDKDAARPVLIRNGRSIYIDGSGAVVFDIEGDCGAVAREIVRHFGQSEWQPRSTQDLNPQLPTSFRIGCQPHGGGIMQLDSGDRPVSQGPYMQWRGEWENEGGDILEYSLGGTGRQLRGYASYAPRLVVEERRRKLRELSSAPPTPPPGSRRTY
jgi:hypothetical protein